MEMDAAAIAAKYFGITATAHPLPGEIDQNVRLEGQDGATYVLRVSPPRTDPDLLELQSEILSVLNGLESIATPWPIPSVSGDEIAVLPDEASMIGAPSRMRPLHSP